MEVPVSGPMLKRLRGWPGQRRRSPAYNFHKSGAPPGPGRPVFVHIGLGGLGGARPVAQINRKILPFQPYMVLSSIEGRPRGFTWYCPGHYCLFMLPVLPALLEFPVPPVPAAVLPGVPAQGLPHQLGQSVGVFQELQVGLLGNIFIAQGPGGANLDAGGVAVAKIAFQDLAGFLVQKGGAEGAGENAA